MNDFEIMNDFDSVYFVSSTSKKSTKKTVGGAESSTDGYDDFDLVNKFDDFEDISNVSEDDMEYLKKIGCNISLTPDIIVNYLDRYIIGQDDAKKAVAISLRSRWRRMHVNNPLRKEIVPKNILMVGPTGVGKTEIARRLAKLSCAPFIKVEATKYTEVGYVGRDVESMIRDLMEKAIHLVRRRMMSLVREEVEVIVDNIIVDILAGEASGDGDTNVGSIRDGFMKRLKSGKLEDIEIEIEVPDTPPPPSQPFDVPGSPGTQMGVINMSDFMGKILGGKKMKKQKTTVKEARSLLIEEESDKLLDQEKIQKYAKYLTENHGIVFIDEVDKITCRNDARGGEVNREGVQRDLLPLLEGTVVSTKHGQINTDHILFIASGAFHLAKPSDLLPEFQGRLPIRVNLKALTRDDILRILKEPEHNLVNQYIALFKSEGIDLKFDTKSLNVIADVATLLNYEQENIGARRLLPIMETILGEYSYDCKKHKGKKVNITEKYTKEKTKPLIKDYDLNKYIL